jgi:hypothetical protein
MRAWGEQPLSLAKMISVRSRKFVFVDGVENGADDGVDLHDVIGVGV